MSKRPGTVSVQGSINAPPELNKELVEKPICSCAKFLDMFNCRGCTPTLQVVAFFAALGGLGLGFDFGLIGGALPYMKEDLGACSHYDSYP